MLANIIICTPSYLSSFTGMWAYRQNVLTCASSYRTCSSIAINISLLINTLCSLLIMSPHTAGLQYLSDLCTAGQSCAACQTQKRVSDHAHSLLQQHMNKSDTFQTSLAHMQTHYHSDTQKNRSICNSAHLFDLSLCRKLHVKDTNKDFGTFPRKRHHKHPATVFVHKNKATSV